MVSRSAGWAAWTLLTVSVVFAQPRPHAYLLRTESASARDARTALSQSRDAIDLCFRNATARDPVVLASLRSIDVTVHLLANGTADAVDLSPDVLPRGLSECLSRVFLGWRQGGHPDFHASVYVRILVTGSAAR